MRYKIDYENRIKKYLEENNKKYTYYIDTFGCALNENDSMKYSGILEECGMNKTYDINNANVVLFNTCTIRENADDKLLGRLGTLKIRKSNKEEVYIAIVGCMTEQLSLREKIKKSYKFVDILLGTKSMHKFSYHLYNLLTKKEKTQDISMDEDSVIENVPIKYVDGVKASVSIIYGCNNFCSYCIVPFVRGRERSRQIDDIIKDIEDLSKKGYKEITLLGQNVNSYGNDLKDKNINFAKLLKEVQKIKGIEVIKFISPHPKDFSDELIGVISNSDKISKQIHLPLQSGSTKILKSMNRKYTKEEYLILVDKIKSKIPCATFSTDIIVGFPGETEDDFLDTLDVVRKVKFDAIYMFCYSRRKNTFADKMECQIPENIKVERLEVLKELNKEIISNKNEELIGKEYNILVESRSKTNDKFFEGRTIDNKIVVFKAEDKDIGKFKKIKIKENHLWYLMGEIKK